MPISLFLVQTEEIDPALLVAAVFFVAVALAYWYALSEKRRLSNPTSLHRQSSSSTRALSLINHGPEIRTSASNPPRNQLSHYDRYIPGTLVSTQNPLSPNPKARGLSYPRGRNGKTPKHPLSGFLHYKFNKNGSHRVRCIKPGKLTPFLSGSATPYVERGNRQQRLPSSGKYRHIGSFSQEELLKMGWDGAMTASATLGGVWVPFVCGYDSDPDNDYENFDVKAAFRAGNIGLPREDIGLYMDIPMKGLVQLKRGTRERTLRTKVL